MVPLSTDFAARIAAETTTLAFCWRITRADGVALGFTSHDLDLEIDGLLYRAAPGIAPSAVHWSGGLEADSMDISGALSADALTETDLAAGRYDGARVSLFMVDWSAPHAGSLPLMRGELGTITHEEAGFTAELKGPAHVFSRPAVELLSPECRAELGDRRCRVDLARHSRLNRIAEVPDTQQLRMVAAEAAPNSLAYGRVRFLAGPNSGCEVAILHSAGNLLHLAEPPPFVCAAGDLVVLLEGCDKRFTTCRQRFDNAENFQGEPHVPGNDLLTRYPGV